MKRESASDQSGSSKSKDSTQKSLNLRVGDKPKHVN